MRKLAALLLLLTFPAHAANIQSSDYAATGGTGNALLTNSAVQVGPVGQRNLTGIFASNPNNATVYLQLFNGTAASVVLGTSVPQAVIPVGSTAPLEVALPDTSAITFTNGLSIAATTTPTGTSAPATGITATIGFQ